MGGYIGQVLTENAVREHPHSIRLSSRCRSDMQKTGDGNMAGCPGLTEERRPRREVYVGPFFLGLFP